MRSRIFISYSEKDKAPAESVLYALESRGTPCWMAPRDIPPGGSYADAIMRAIEECACFVLVYTRNSNGSPHVLREVERALKFERNIIPVRFDASEPSRSLDYLLATVHWLSVDPKAVKTDLNRAADQISKCARAGEITPKLETQGEQKPPSYATVPTVHSDKTRKPAILKVLLAVAVLIVGLLLFFSRAWVVNWLRQNRTSSQTISSTSPTAAPLPPSPAPSVLTQKQEQQEFLTSPSPVPTAVASQPTSEVEASFSPQPSIAEKMLREETAPQKVLRMYFNCFAERDVQTAYDLFSKQFRAGTSFRKYSDLFSSTREIKLLKSALVSQTQDKAVVFVQFEETDSAYHKTGWQGPIELIRESSEWRIKTLHELKKVPANEQNGNSTQQEIRSPGKSWPKSHVYLQLANESQRNAALELKRRLVQMNCEVVGIQSVPNDVDLPTETSEIRYFWSGDAAEAQKIANQIQSFFSSTGIIQINFETRLGEGKKVSHARQYEIWFSTAFH